MAASPSSYSVLVIDDDAVMREVLSALLSAEGHTVETVEDGESALRALQDGSVPEVILADMQLPGLAGAALGKQLRSAAPKLTLLAMSGSQPAAEDRSAFDGFLLKPFTPADFTAAATASKQEVRDIPSDPSASARPSEDAALNEATYARLAQSLASGPLAELYSLTLQDITERLVRMEEARNYGNHATYRSEAHALKGGCSMVGAVELARLAARAESPESSPSNAPAPQHFTLALERLRSILSSRFGHVA